MQTAEKEIITVTSKVTISLAATTTPLVDKTMHTENKTNRKFSKTLSNKTSICEKVKEKRTVNIISTENIEENEYVEKWMGDTQRKPR